MASKVEIAGPGFLNIFLDEAFLAQQADAALADCLGKVAAAEAQTIVADYSAPNAAKGNARWPPYVQRSSVMLLFVHLSS
ncbi:hypothetical protein O9992_03785 [Vibrio lentus]|nr:hypothetical protein [Vibrio lentus]